MLVSLKGVHLHDPYTFFALILVKDAVEKVRQFITGSGSRLLAREAWAWLAGADLGRRGLSFQFICGCFDWDHLDVLAAIKTQIGQSGKWRALRFAGGAT